MGQTLVPSILYLQERISLVPFTRNNTLSGLKAEVRESCQLSSIKLDIKDIHKNVK